MNRFDIDARLLAGSGVKLDRALFPILSRVQLNPCLTTAELANLTGRDHSTISRQISRLEELGLIARVPSKSDRRARILKPTAQGRRLLEGINAVRSEWMEQHFQNWNAADRDQLLKLLDRALNVTALSPLSFTEKHAGQADTTARTEPI